MSDEPEETSYYLRLLSMYMDLGTEIVLDVFVYHTPGQDAETFLKSNQSRIVQLKESRVLNEQECDLLFQKGTKVLKSRLEIKNLDISLSITLSRNLFTDSQLTPPVKGWNNPPRNSDKSIAADLIRLKKTRNVIIGHHPRARIPRWRFDNEWKNVSEILIRLQQQIAPGKEVSLTTRIETYRLQLLDPTVSNKYNEKLKSWHTEVTAMQDQVEDLIQKLGGFEAYFNRKSDRFERFTKLLLKGGRFVLSAFLDKKIKEEGKDLRVMLKDNEGAIRRIISDKEQLDELFPANSTSPTDPINTSSWTVSLLAAVILQLFNNTVDKGVKQNITKIGDAYNNYANATLLALDSNAFEDYWTDLKTSINIVSYGLDDRNAECCYQILDECKKKIDEKEFKTYMEELKSQGTQIKSFTETFKDVLQRTKDFLQDMITRGISFKNAQVLELKMITLGNDEQQKQLAEEILIEVWNKALDRAVQSEDFLDVKREVLKILEEIKKSKSVENISVRAKCILLQIKSTSPREMLDMIEFFQSSQFHETIKNISIELGYFFDTALEMISVITVECLWTIYNQTDKTVNDEEGGLSLQMTVSSPAGMKHLISLCSKDTIANCTNSIADALSKHLGGTIALKAVADIKEFKHVFDTDSSSSDSCSDYSSMESIVQDIIYSSQINALTEGKGYISRGLSVEESTDAVEELNKHIEGATYALKSLNLTPNETDYRNDSEKETRSLEIEAKELEHNVKIFQESLEELNEKMVADEKEEYTAKTLIEVDEGWNKLDKGNILKDKEKALKKQNAIKDVHYQDTKPIGEDSEDTFQTIALLELYQSQVAVAQYLDLAACHSLQDGPYTGRSEIISTFLFAKDTQVATMHVYESDLTTLAHIMLTLRVDAPFFQRDLRGALKHASKLKTSTEHSKKRYIKLQTKVKTNTQQVEQSVCSEKEYKDDQLTAKKKRGNISGFASKLESYSTYGKSQRKIKSYMDRDIFAKKKKVEKNVLHLLRPGLAFTGGIASSESGFFYCYELFILIEQANELDLRRHAERMTPEEYTDSNMQTLVDHIVKQRKNTFDRLEAIRKQEENKVLECLKEVTRNLESIDTQFTRMINCWSDLIDNIEFLLKHKEIHINSERWNIYVESCRKEWEVVEELFYEYGVENVISTSSLYK